MHFNFLKPLREVVPVAIVLPEKVAVQSCSYWLSEHKKEACVLVVLASWSVSWTAKSQSSVVGVKAISPGPG